MTRSARTAGFTLVEMMVALVAGAMAVTSIYFVSASSSRHFQEQQRVAQTQMSLRMAMEQIRRDFSRAGYLGTPDSQREQQCVAPGSRIQAIDMVNGAFTGLLTNAVMNGVQADRVLLTGNFATGDAYLAIGTNANGNQIFLQKTWQGFRRSFGDPADDALFQQVFAAGRWVHLTTQDGNHFFAQILSSDAASSPPSIQINTSLPVGSACFQIGAGATIAPVMRIEYAVLNSAIAGSPVNTLRTTNTIAGLNGPTLIRREVSVTGGRASVPVANTERIVAEYLADFDVDFVVNTAAAGLPVALAFDDDDDAEMAATPYNVRSAVVRLSVRTALEDERFPFVPRAAGAPLTRYEVNTAAGTGAARVRTETSEFLLPNVALRDLR
jgi:prepilin-type N-terminal cleavage/methylation domain-containing protein